MTQIQKKKNTHTHTRSQALAEAVRKCREAIMVSADVQVLQCVAMCCSVCVASCCIVLQCVALCCSVFCVLQRVAGCDMPHPRTGDVFPLILWALPLQRVAVCCSVLQRVAACCSVLQRVAACCSVLQSVAACCSVLHDCFICSRHHSIHWASPLQCVAACSACCSMLQCVT